MDNLVEFFGRLHPLIVHLPIGFLMLTVGFHWLVWRGKYAALRDLLPVLWLICCISAVLACVAGYLLSLSGDYSAQALNIHMYLGIALALASGLIYLLLQKGYWGKYSLSAVAVVALLLLATGHYGGNLTHGEDYLTQPLYALVGKAPAKPVRQPILNLEEALVYQDLVEPILEEKCWQCHSAEKQKGKLRLDAAAFLLQGGKHGPVLAAGNAGESSLYKRLLLPETDDKRMPPKGKPQLTVAEIQLIHWWITQGQADFKKKVADLPKNDQIKPVLAALGKESTPAAATAGSVAEIPTVKVVKPNPADLQQLEKIGVTFTPLTPDHSFLAANLVNNTNFNDEQMALLLKLQDQIVWLDLSETAITDKALAHIARFKHLTRLQLDNTRITDAALGHLKQLPHLRTLNLYGTQVSDKGLAVLQSCKNLQSVYLWQTQATPKGVAALQQALGEQAEINFGITSEITGSL
jgi:uncharacterized membrane protein